VLRFDFHVQGWWWDVWCEWAAVPECQPAARVYPPPMAAGPVLATRHMHGWEVQGHNRENAHGGTVSLHTAGVDANYYYEKKLWLVGFIFTDSGRSPAMFVTFILGENDAKIAMKGNQIILVRAYLGKNCIIFSEGTRPTCIRILL